jgi:hypothetical protein
MDIRFHACPDCRCYNSPDLERSPEALDNYGNITNGLVKAKCTRCGWSTNYHGTVKECEEEWNKCHDNDVTFLDDLETLLRKESNDTK